MDDKEIIEKWRQGLSKERLALIYKRQFNQGIRIIRSDVRHRHDGRLISNFEALGHVEQVIYKYFELSVYQQANRLEYYRLYYFHS